MPGTVYNWESVLIGKIKVNMSMTRLLGIFDAALLAFPPASPVASASPAEGYLIQLETGYFEHSLSGQAA